MKDQHRERYGVMEGLADLEKVCARPSWGTAKKQAVWRKAVGGWGRGVGVAGWWRPGWKASLG